MVELAKVAVAVATDEGCFKGNALVVDGACGYVACVQGNVNLMTLTSRWVNLSLEDKVPPPMDTLGLTCKGGAGRTNTMQHQHQDSYSHHPSSA
eukprot:12083735-Ditylum_brightwellii.AAC.1